MLIRSSFLILTCLSIAVIEGSSIDSVTRASEKIQAIVEEVCSFVYVISSSSCSCTFFER